MHQNVEVKLYGDLQEIAGKSSLNEGVTARIEETMAAYLEHTKRVRHTELPMTADTILDWTGADIGGSRSDAVVMETALVNGWHCNTPCLLVPLPNDMAGPPPHQSCQLQLIRKMVGGYGGFFQVWKVDLLSRGSDGDMQKGIPLVLKLYDTARLPAPDAMSFMPWEDDEFGQGIAQPATYAMNEAAAYTKLRILQGARIPHSYGHYKFALPQNSNQHLFGLLTEYLGGDTVDIALLRSAGEAIHEPQADTSGYIDMLKKIMELEQLMRSMDVMHLGIDHSSVIMHNGQMKFVGFSRSTHTADPIYEDHCLGSGLSEIIESAGLSSNDPLNEWYDSL